MRKCRIVVVSEGEMRLDSERRARYGWAAEILTGGKVLDAACGEGWGTAMLSKGGAAVGIDFSPAGIAAARREHGGEADFLEGDVRKLPLEDGEFDCVVCFETLTHVPNPEAVLDELHRVLRPGGLLLVSAPNRTAYPPGNPLQLSELSSAELEELLAARFAKVAIHHQRTHFASMLGNEVKHVLASGGNESPELHAVAAATDGELPPAPAWLALGEAVDYAEQRQQLEEWKDRAVRAEAEALALRKLLEPRRGDP